MLAKLIAHEHVIAVNLCYRSYDFVTCENCRVKSSTSRAEFTIKFTQSAKLFAQMSAGAFSDAFWAVGDNEL